jgi:hypothetical protein
MILKRGHLGLLIQGQTTSLAKYATDCFGHLLPLHQEISAEQFADLIEGQYSLKNPKTKEVVDHLKSQV